MRRYNMWSSRGLNPHNSGERRKRDGLMMLAKHDRLDCAYEQIAIDYHAELPEDVVKRARQTLTELKGARM